MREVVVVAVHRLLLFLGLAILKLEAVAAAGVLPLRANERRLLIVVIAKVALFLLEKVALALVMLLVHLDIHLI